MRREAGTYRGSGAEREREAGSLHNGPPCGARRRKSQVFHREGVGGLRRGEGEAQSPPWLGQAWGEKVSPAWHPQVTQILPEP